MNRVIDNNACDPSMTRVILTSNDVLTPFDLRAQIFRVNEELSAYQGGQFFSKKMSESDLWARKNFIQKQSISNRQICLIDNVI